MPRIWLDYCQFLMDQCKITRTRRTFDRALRALPLTQHSRIWPLYIKFIQSHKLPETALRVYRRYLKVSRDMCVYHKLQIFHVQNILCDIELVNKFWIDTLYCITVNNMLIRFPLV